MLIGIDIRLIGKKQTGSEAVFFNLVKNLAFIDTKNKYKLLTDITEKITLEKVKNYLEIGDKSNFEIISLYTKNKFTWNFWTLPRYLRSHPIEVYLTQYILPFFVPSRVKLITIIHDISFKIYPQFIKYSDLFFLNWLIPISLRRADKILGVSRFTRDEIIKHYKVAPEKVDWFYNAVGTEFTRKMAEITQSGIDGVKKKYGLPEKYILYIGTLQPRKNISVLIEAYTKVHPSELRRVNLRLVIAGGRGHNYDTRIDENIRKYKLEKKVILPGFVEEEDKAAIIAGAQIFCFPSFYEGFGIPILEAMAAGTPVVASDIAPHREIAGGAAILFDPKNPVELAEKISEIINDDDLRKSLVQKGKAQVRSFSWQKTAEKMLEVFGN